MKEVLAKNKFFIFLFNSERAIINKKGGNLLENTNA